MDNKLKKGQRFPTLTKRGKKFIVVKKIKFKKLLARNEKRTKIVGAINFD